MTTVFESYVPIAEYKTAFADAWTFDRDLIPVRGEHHAASVGRTRFQLRRHFGRVHRHQDNVFDTVEKIDLRRHWVRVSVLPRDEFDTYNGTSANRVTLGVGVCLSSSQRAFRREAGRDRLGEQRFTVVGGDRLLGMVKLNGSFWDDDDGSAMRLGRMPTFNVRNADGSLTGNRTAAKIGDAYAFGGTSLWTARDVAEYLLFWFASQTVTPNWSLSGAGLNKAPTGDAYSRALDDVVPFVPQSLGESVEDVLRRAIAPRFGFDYSVQADEINGAYAVDVFALLSETSTWETNTAPVNPNVYAFDLDALEWVDYAIEESTAQLYESVRIIGAPIRVALSASNNRNEPPNTLERAWSSAEETEYLEAKSADDADKQANDEYRSTDRFRYVFQGLKIDPTTWDWQGGLVAPYTDDDGSLLYLTGVTHQRGQTVVRTTHGDLPMRVGVDYANGSTDRNPVGQTGEWRDAFAIVYDENAQRFHYVDQHGQQGDAIPANIDVLREEWGIVLNTNPNHAFGVEEWFTVSNIGPSGLDYRNEADKTRGRSWKQIIATFSIDADRNVEIAGSLAAPSDFGFEQIITMPEAALWIIAPGTVVDVDENGELKQLGATSADAVVTRDDRDQMRSAMAFAQGRFGVKRNRARITFASLTNIHIYTGAIIGTIVTGDDETTVDAPHTSTLWDFERMMTTVLAGQANRG